MQSPMAGRAAGEEGGRSGGGAGGGGGGLVSPTSDVVKEAKASMDKGGSEEVGARPPGEERAREGKAGEQEAGTPRKVARLQESETGNQVPAVLA